MIHEDPKIVPEERARDAERPGRSQHERLTHRKKRGGQHGREGRGEERDGRLFEERALKAERNKK